MNLRDVGRFIVGTAATFVVLNAAGFAFYAVFRPRDEGVDTLLFYASIVVSPLVGIVTATSKSGPGAMVIRVLLALIVLPFGWTLGLAIAFIFAGKSFGQLPVMTVPIGILAAIAFALVPFRTELTRFMIMLVGTVVGFLVFGAITEPSPTARVSATAKSPAKPAPVVSASSPLATRAPVPEGATALQVVDVAAPAINCVFDQSCKIVANDASVRIALGGVAGEGSLQSRVNQAQPGSPAAGLYVYEYRIDVGNLAATADGPLITSLSIDFGPVVGTLDYNGDGNTGDQIFVVTRGGTGSIAVTSAYQAGNIITFTFSPGIRAGKAAWDGGSSFFFGLASAKPPTFVAARLTANTGATLDVQTRGPGLP